MLLELRHLTDSAVPIGAATQLVRPRETEASRKRKKLSFLGEEDIERLFSVIPSIRGPLLDNLSAA
jgi:hypothetical protein